MAKRIDYKIVLDILSATMSLITMSLLLYTFFQIEIELIKTQVVELDIGNDGRIESVILSNNNLKIIDDNSNLVFQTNSEYEVNFFDYGDLNNDGINEFVYGFWRYGDYVKNIPGAEVRRGEKKGYHIDIYEINTHKSYNKILWGSSTLPYPINKFEITEINNTNVLKISEGRYEDYDKYGEIRHIEDSYWIWDEWWFEEYDPKNTDEN